MNERSDQPNPADVLDPHTKKVRVLARQCSTCIFRPEDPMRLGEERTRQVIDGNLQAGALLTCHATLPHGEYPDFGPAVCAGFWARHRNDVPAGRIAQLCIGIIRVDPPLTTTAESNARRDLRRCPGATDLTGRRLTHPQPRHDTRESP